MAAEDYSSGILGAIFRILPTTVLKLGTEAQCFLGSMKSINKDEQLGNGNTVAPFRPNLASSASNVTAKKWTKEHERT